MVLSKFKNKSLFLRWLRTYAQDHPTEIIDYWDNRNCLFSKWLRHCYPSKADKVWVGGYYFNFEDVVGEGLALKDYRIPKWFDRVWHGLGTRFTVTDALARAEEVLS